MTDPNNTTAAEPVPGIIEDFIDIFGSPSQVFARRARGGAFAPFLVTCLLLIGLMFVNRGVMSNIMDTQMAKGIAAAQQKGNMTPEQMEKVAEAQKAVAKYAFVGVAVSTPVTLLLFALVAWLVGKMFGSVMTFGMSLMVVSFSWVPKVVEQVLLSVQGMLLDTSTMTEPAQVSLGLARFLDHASTSSTVFAAAMRVDPIILWSTFLLATGFMAAGKMEKGKAWTAALVLWVAGFLPVLYGAMKAG